jgi:hypothetical protein
MLRQQALGELHRPLIVMTPKSMLRNKLAVSEPADFTQGSWKPVVADPGIEDTSQVNSVLLCSGKIRWDLVNARSQAGKDGQVAIIALERLYPLPAKDLAKQLRRFDRVEEVRWVQDEPGNQGAWPFMALNLPQLAESSGGGGPGPRPGRRRRSVGSASVHATACTDGGRLRIRTEGGATRRRRRRPLLIGNMYSRTGVSKSSRRAGVRMRSPWRGWLISYAPLSTYIQNSKHPSNASRRGWPASTMRRMHRSPDANVEIGLGRGAGDREANDFFRIHRHNERVALSDPPPPEIHSFCNSCGQHGKPLRVDDTGVRLTPARQMARTA